MARLKYQILFILYQIVGRCCRDVVLLILWWNITVWELLKNHINIAHGGNFGHLTSIIVHDPLIVYGKSPTTSDKNIQVWRPYLK